MVKQTKGANVEAEVRGYRANEGGKGANVRGMGGVMLTESFRISRDLRFGNQLGRTLIPAVLI